LDIRANRRPRRPPDGFTRSTQCAGRAFSLRDAMSVSVRIRRRHSAGSDTPSKALYARPPLPTVGVTLISHRAHALARATAIVLGQLLCRPPASCGGGSGRGMRSLGWCAHPWVMDMANGLVVVYTAQAPRALFDFSGTHSASAVTPGGKQAKYARSE